MTIEFHRMGIEAPTAHVLGIAVVSGTRLKTDSGVSKGTHLTIGLWWIGIVIWLSGPVPNKSEDNEATMLKETISALKEVVYRINEWRPYVEREATDLGSAVCEAQNTITKAEGVEN